MNEKQRDAVVESLVDFVIRVAAGKNVGDAETAALPAVVAILAEL